MRFIHFICLLIGIHSAFAQSKPEPVNEKYLGQFPNIRDFTLAQDEAYFSVQSPLGEQSVILCMKKKGDKWSKPEIAAFSGKYQDLEPFMTPDGLRLYFASNRPRGDIGRKDFDIWMVTRATPDDEWSAPKNLGEPVNSSFNEFYPVFTTSNNLYFTTDARGSEGGDDIVVCEWDNGKYKQPVSLGPSINSAGYEFNAFVAPDESYIIFTGYNREDSYGSGDLYISFKSDDNWAKPINLGDNINSEHMDYCPFILANTLYFTSRRKNLQIPENGFTTLKELINEFNQYDNGQSRIFRIDAFDPLDYQVK
ncbi:MAG: TolB family protein [Bacteroidota bacterium]